MSSTGNKVDNKILSRHHRVPAPAASRTNGGDSWESSDGLKILSIWTPLALLNFTVKVRSDEATR